MKAVLVVGDSGSGKTTLIERLVPALAERGRVATVKSIHHDVELDTEGKDTYRHRRAGAHRVIGVTPSLTVTFEAGGKEDAVDEAAVLGRHLADLLADGYRYVLVEGFSAAPLPAILVGNARGRGSGRVVVHVPEAEEAAVERVVEAIEETTDWEPAGGAG